MRQIALDDTTYSQIKETAKAEGRTMSGLIRIMIRNWNNGSITIQDTSSAVSISAQDPYEHALKWWDKTPKEEMGKQDANGEMDMLKLLYDMADKGKGREDITGDDVALAMDYLMKNNGVRHPGNKAV